MGPTAGKPNRETIRLLMAAILKSKYKANFRKLTLVGEKRYFAVIKLNKSINTEYAKGNTFFMSPCASCELTIIQ